MMEDYREFWRLVATRPYLTRADLLLHLDAWVRNAVAWEPTYLSGVGGNGQRILLKDGGEVFACVPFAVLTELVCERYHLNSEPLKKRYKSATGKSLGLPLVMGNGRSFAAVQSRKHPRGKNDGCTMYIDVDAVASVESAKTGSVIHLKSGLTLKSVWSRRAVQDRLDEGRSFRDSLCQLEIVAPVPTP